MGHYSSQGHHIKDHVMLCQDCVHENGTFKSGDESFCRLMPVSFWLMLLVLGSRALS